MCVGHIPRNFYFCHGGVLPKSGSNGRLTVGEPNGIEFDRFTLVLMCQRWAGRKSHETNRGSCKTSCASLCCEGSILYGGVIWNSIFKPIGT